MNVQPRSGDRELDEPMRFTLRATSSDRSWSGIEAIVYETSGGFTRSHPATHYSLSMHLSAPIRTRCGFENPTFSRLQLPEDIDLLAPGTTAAWQDEGETTMLGLHLSPSLVHNAAEGMGLSASSVGIAPCLQMRDPQIAHIAWALKAELESDEQLGRVYAESLGIALASHLLRRYSRPHVTTPAGQLSKRRLKTVIEYVHDHLAHDLSLTELAEIAEMSPSHFKVLFKRSVGLAVHQYIIRRRVEYAIQLIAAGRIPLDDIAAQAGFSSQSHMSRFIRRFTGVSPGALRDRPEGDGEVF